ncbi:MAG: carboxypeptidase-like regulatory domain-containing protein, partial [Ginsengibacter sp.]
MIKSQLRFPVLALLVALLFISEAVNAQTAMQYGAKSERKVYTPLSKALKDVSKVFDTKFVYEKSLMEGKITSYAMQHIKGKKVEDVLKSILYPQGLVFLYIKQNYYTIVSRDRFEQQSYPAKNSNLEDKSNGTGQGNIISAYSSFGLQAENNSINDHTVKGHVRNSDGRELQGVSIVVEGTGNGTMTNASGAYSLNRVADNAVLVFSYIGFTTEKIPVQGRTVVDILLHESNTGLNEVVVVGYGTQKKENLTGAVASISSKELENKPLPNVGEVLRGVSPNLNINLGAYGAEPGADLKFNIRGLGSISGNSAPLILVDGVEMDIN